MTLSQSDRNAAAGPIGGGLQSAPGSLNLGSIPLIGPAEAGAIGSNLPLIHQALQGVANQTAGSGTVSADQAGAKGQVAGANDPNSNLPLQSALYQNAHGGQNNLSRQDSGGPLATLTSNWPRNGQLVHGYMKTAAESGNPSIPKEFFVYFLFNPLEIDNSYNFDSNVLPAAFQSQAVSQSEAAIMQNQQLTFTLPFDRTYEVSNFMQGPIAKGGQTPPDPAKNPAVGPGSLGVMWDIRAIERLVGMYDDTQLPTSNQGSGTGNVQPSGTPNPAQAAPVDVFFGQHFYFRGYFSQLEVDVQRFSHTMVPVHCEVTITLSRIWLDPKLLDLSHGPKDILGGNALITPRLGADGAPVLMSGNPHLVPGITTFNSGSGNATQGTNTAGGGNVVGGGNSIGDSGGPAPTNPTSP